MSRSVDDKKNIFNATTRSQVVLILELNMEILDVSFFVVCCCFVLLLLTLNCRLYLGTHYKLIRNQ